MQFTQRIPIRIDSTSLVHSWNTCRQSLAVKPRLWLACWHVQCTCTLLLPDHTKYQGSDLITAWIPRPPSPHCVHYDLCLAWVMSRSFLQPFLILYHVCRVCGRTRHLQTLHPKIVPPRVCSSLCVKALVCVYTCNLSQFKRQRRPDPALKSGLTNAHARHQNQLKLSVTCVLSTLVWYQKCQCKLDLVCCMQAKPGTLKLTLASVRQTRQETVERRGNVDKSCPGGEWVEDYM